MEYYIIQCGYNPPIVVYNTLGEAENIAIAYASSGGFVPTYKSRFINGVTYGIKKGLYGGTLRIRSIAFVKSKSDSHNFLHIAINTEPSTEWLEMYNQIPSQSPGDSVADELIARAYEEQRYGESHD